MGLSSLLGWWRWPARPVQLEFVMYTRQGCHLCEDAWQLLEAAQARHGFGLTSVDVDSDPRLAQEYG
jgi:hypothetical protein